MKMLQWQFSLLTKSSSCCQCYELHLKSGNCHYSLKNVLQKVKFSMSGYFSYISFTQFPKFLTQLHCTNMKKKLVTKRDRICKSNSCVRNCHGRLFLIFFSQLSLNYERVILFASHVFYHNYFFELTWIKYQCTCQYSL